MITRTQFISAPFVFGLKSLSKMLYKTKAEWLTPIEQIDWPKIRVVVILNHTSLFEPLFISAIPNIRLWRAMNRVVVPIADTTMNRPVAGRLFRFLVPNSVSITRKRDNSWSNLLNKIKEDSILLIFPEGRMKRLDGLDKNGKPMTVKGGIADILSKIEDGKMLVAYSGGLHHVQAPGQLTPNIFKTIRIKFEEIDIPTYKEALKSSDDDGFRTNVMDDLQKRMEKNC